MSNSIRIGLVLSVALAASPTARSAATSVGPDAAGYTATDETSYSFVNIAATGIRTLALTDDGTTAASIGFPFAFYGSMYNDLCVSANGYLLFGGCTDAFLNQDLSGAQTPGNRPMIAPLWTDLTFLWPTADAVYYETLGTAPARQFVVQWNRAFAQNAPRPITLQAILYEGSNTLRFQYQSLDAGGGSAASNGATATVGICDAGGAAAGRCLQWSYNAAVLRNEMAIFVDPHTAPPAPPMSGRMHGSGFIIESGTRYGFQFDVRESAAAGERGTFRLTVEGDGKPRPRNDRFTSHTVGSVIFSDDPNVQPGGSATADTALFNGVGEWNGEPGYAFEVSARDEGEPAQGRESIRLTITSPAGVVVARAEGALDGGNVQSTRIKE